SNRQSGGTGADDAKIGGELLGHGTIQDLFDGTPASSLRPKRRFATAGTSASTASAPSAHSNVGVSTCDRSKSTVQPLRPPATQASYWTSCTAMTLPRPAPSTAKVTVAGRMPIPVAAMKVENRTPNSAGARLTSQNGKIGASRRNS